MTGPSKRKPWIAALLALATPGLGHMYVGRPGRAIAIWLMFFVAVPLLVIASFALLAKPLNILVPFLFSNLFGILVLFDAVVIARRSPSEYELKWWNRWYVYALVFLVVGMGTREIGTRYVIEAYRVPSGSMENTLLVGDY